MAKAERSLTKEQEQFVRDNYKDMNYRQIANHLGVCWDWLRHMAVKELGLKRGRWGSQSWGEKESARFRDAFPTTSKDELLKMFPGRSWCAMLHHADRLGIEQTVAVSMGVNLAPTNMTPTEAAYIAGLIDGEGSVFILKTRANTPSPYLICGLMICNTDLKMIEFVRKICGGTVTKRLKDPREAVRGYRADFYVLNIRNYRALGTLLAVTPYMITKKAPAEVVIRYLQLRASKRRNSPQGEEEFALHSEWRKLCPPKGSPEWEHRYST